MMQRKPKAKGGQPKYDKAVIFPVLCSLVSMGGNLDSICKEPGMPAHSTVIQWMLDDATFSEDYARARDARADARSDRIDGYVVKMLKGEIDPQQCRVAIDAEKWQAGKEQPKRYGDKLDLNHSGEVKTIRITTNVEE
jgi:hypothetical protein